MLAEFQDLDGQTNGLLINSENFQALNLIQEKYRGEIKSHFIDPPYNTEEDRAQGKFIYKDDFTHSSWISMMNDRVKLSKGLLKKDGLFFCSLDDNEIYNMKNICDSVFGQNNFKANFIWNSRKSKQNDIDVSLSHNYILSYSVNKNKKELLGIPLNENEFSNPDNDVRGKWKISPLDAPGVRERTSFFSIENPNTKESYFPPKGRHWTIFEENVNENIENGNIYFGKEGKSKPQWKRYWIDVSNDSKTIGTIWDDVDTATNASKELQNLFNNKDFETPKPTNLMYDIGQQVLEKDDFFLDYFAGSGTSGHAVIKLNREDEGNRKYILVEMGSYFNTVTKPRIQKVIYTDNWKNGKSQEKKGISQMFKYIVLESYEDTLNNLVLEQTESQQGALALNDKVREEYMLQYMLDVESQSHLFNLEAFKNPFNYKLNVTENNELMPTTVDLVETFNYLIGLKVQKVERIKDFKLVIGINNKEDKVIVIWRDLEKTNNDDLNRFVEKLDIKVFDGEFDIIYVNGDNNLANLKKEDDHWKVRLIEEEFFSKMFDVKDI